MTQTPSLIRTAICLHRNLQDTRAKIICDLIKNGLNFQPTKMRHEEGEGERRRGRKFNQEKAISELQKVRQLTQFELQTEAEFLGPMLSFIRLPNFSIDAIYVDQPGAVPHDLLLEISKEPDFCAAYVFSLGETRSKPMIVEGRVTSQSEKILAFPGMWLRTAWRTYWSSWAVNLIGLQKIRDLTGLSRKELYPSGLFFMQMYDDPDNFDKPENQASKRNMQTTLEFERLHEEGMLLLKSQSDPHLEIQLNGPFPHGGMRRYIHWLDHREKPARRSAASLKLTREFEKNGQILWEETEKVASSPPTANC